MTELEQQVLAQLKEFGTKVKETKAKNQQAKVARSQAVWNRTLKQVQSAMNQAIMNEEMTFDVEIGQDLSDFQRSDLVEWIENVSSSYKASISTRIIEEGSEDSDIEGDFLTVTWTE